MSLIEIFKHAWKKAQDKQVCHKKLIKLVENAFDKSKLDEFLKIYIKALYHCYYTNYADKNAYCARGLEFLAKIGMKITLECVEPIGITNADGTTSHVYDITLDPFFTSVLKYSLKYSEVDKAEIRFNTCYFITSLLQNIGNNVEMDYSICNIILDSLVPLLHDPKANVRIQAIKALVRLQEPSNADCIVLKSFLILSTDPNSEVRKAIINHIAPNPQSYVKIRLRTLDTDQSVRQAAYQKFADVNPKLCLKIIDRNIILNNGLNDQNKKIKHIMSETLLPKWLNSFEGNYLNFFRALRLDADENDINNFEKLCTEILDIFLRKNSLTDIVNYLPVNKDDKLIPIQQLRLESVFYWSNLINYLRNVEDGEEYLANILPEMTAFSNYIERVVKEKSHVTMDEWENLEYQTILFQLFKIASGFDMSDEVGRKTLYALILQILTNNKFHQKVIDKILQVAAQLNSDVGSLTIDLCQIISEIREPLINEMPSEDQLRKRNFEITQMKVKIHQLEINEEEALKKKDFQLAHMVQNEMKDCQRALDNLKNMYNVSEKVRVARDDPDTLCRCLDILIGLLKIPSITTMCPALCSCRDEFLMPLLSNNSSEILWRFILCLGLFSLMDKDLAFKHINFLCLPIATYRFVPNCDKMALKTSIVCVTDVVRVFGVKVLGMEENCNTELNQENNQTTSRRKLYSEDLSQPEVLNKDDITIEFIIDIIVDMLDDEDEGVRQAASTSIHRLIVHNFPVSPELICRLILKWYNPETEKHDSKLNMQVGTIIECFATRTNGARRVVQKAVLPIISSIVNASGSSPLLEVDIENVLRFLAALTNDEHDTIHDELALNLIDKMLNKPNDACSPYFIKLLTYLELTFKDLEMCKNISDSIELLLCDIVDKIPKKYLLKFRDKVLSGVKNASILTQGDQSELHMTNGTQGKIDDQSSVTRKSLVNGELPNGNHVQHGDIDGSEKESERNEKGNISSSESDSEEDSVESNSKRSDSTKSSGKRLIVGNDEKSLFEGKTKLRKITEEPEQENESDNSVDCGESTENSEDDIEEKDARVEHNKDEENDQVVCVKYDYTPEKNAAKLKNLKKASDNAKDIKDHTSESESIRSTSQIKSPETTSEISEPRATRSKKVPKIDKDKVNSQVEPQKKTEKRLKKDDHSEGSSRSTRSNKKLMNDNVKILSQIVFNKTSRKELEGNKTSGIVKDIKDHTSESESIQSTSQLKIQETTSENLESGATRSKKVPKIDSDKVNSQVETQKKTEKRLKKDEPSEGFSRSTRSNRKSISQTAFNEASKKELEDNQTLESSLRKRRSNGGLKHNDNVQNISQLELHKQNKKDLETTAKRKSDNDEPTEGPSRTTRSNQNSQDNNIQKLSKTTKENSDRDKPLEVSSQSTRSNIIKAKNRLRSNSNNSPKKKRLNEQKQLRNETTSNSSDTDVKKSSRKTSTPSKFKDFITPSVVKQGQQLRTSTKHVEKRTAETPLSTIVNRKSKRLSKNPTDVEQQTPNKANNSISSSQVQNSQTPRSVGMRSVKRFSKPVATNSIKRQKRKSRPSLAVDLKRTLRNTPKSRTYHKRQLHSANSRVKKESNRVKKIKLQQEVKSSKNEKDDEPSSSDDSDSVFKKPRQKTNKEIPKEKQSNNKKSKEEKNGRTDSVLQNLNSVMNEMNNTSINRRSSRISDKGTNESSSTVKKSKTKSKKPPQQETAHSSTSTRSRLSNNQLNLSNSSSRKKLDFSSFSDETILKTFLQGDEEFQVIENMSIEDVNSSNDSKKENLSINVSTTSSSPRRSTRRKRNDSSSPEAPPKKTMRTKNRKKLQRVSQ